MFTAGLAAVLLVGCQSSGNPDPASASTSEATAAKADDSTASPATDAEGSTTATASTTTAPTETTLTESEQLFAEQVADAERYMGSIRSYREARQACLFELKTCDFSFADYMTEAAGDSVVSSMRDRIATGVHFEYPRYETFFVQSLPASAQTIEVWVCASYEVVEFRRNENGEQIEAELLDAPVEFQVYEIVDQGDDSSPLINRIVFLNQDEDPQPEAGTCDEYKEWPPPTP